jgi:hypothetical protein
MAASSSPLTIQRVQEVASADVLGNVGGFSRTRTKAYVWKAVCARLIFVGAMALDFLFMRWL